MARAAARRRRLDRRGSSVVAAVLVLLVLASLAWSLSAVIAGDHLLVANQVEAARAFYAAEAGLEFATAKLGADPGWPGTSPPGWNVGTGSFAVAVADTAPDGSPLPAGRKWIIATGHSGQAERQLRLLVGSGP